MAKELPKIYDANAHEDRVYSEWEASGLFNPDVCVAKGVAKADAEPFSIVLPPPNATGRLHVGHAVMLALQDVMVRYHRMKGDRTLWVPGTDHASIATESKVEKNLMKEEGMKNPKQELGREAFVQRVVDFVENNRGAITEQCRKMGASLDWSREAYTLDDKRADAVRVAFARMYDEGIIYRGYRVVNWSVAGGSTCSDDELVTQERKATLYTFKYSKDFPIAISTTRPETKLGDTAVAVHPEDERYQQYIGQTFTVDVGAAKPLAIKVIASEQVEKDFGTGALGVTPAHSIIDFEMYEAQKAADDPIGLIQVISEDGKMTAAAGPAYEGCTVLEAREKFVAWLRENELIEREEEVVQNVSTSDRFEDVVEPLPKMQWWIDVNKEFERDGETVTIKGLMQRAVRSGATKIVPERFEKIYFNWIDNLRDWNISRQLYFGHRVPVWYRGEEVYVGIESPAGEGWQQDPDTLDTWFSSGLWTFSTLGWPNEEAADFKLYHPTSVLETGHDIIFFWVARMILMSQYLVGEVPFKTVYLHGLVRDEKGRKMSKSLGNVLDPLDIIPKYGTDAIRLALMIGTTPGNDVKLGEEKIASYRNFTNKLWNISRYILSTVPEGTTGPNIQPVKVLGIKTPVKSTKFSGGGPTTAIDQWMMEHMVGLIINVTKDIEEFRFSQAGERLRDFTWNDFADWYVEASKFEQSSYKNQLLVWFLETLLKLWHPFMPFVTEVIWKEMGHDTLLMVEPWPKAEYFMGSSDGTGYGGERMSFDTVKDAITAIRSLRSDYDIKPSEKIKVIIRAHDRVSTFEGQTSLIKQLRTGISELIIEETGEKIKQAAYAVVDGVEIFIPLEGLVDLAAEKEKLTKRSQELKKLIENMERKLDNEEFVRHAPKDIVEGEIDKLEKYRDESKKVKEQVKNL